MNEQTVIHIEAIEIQTKFRNIDKEDINESILKSDLDKFVKNKLDAAVGGLQWTLTSSPEPCEDQLPFDMYTLTYRSRVNQEEVVVTVICE